MDSFNTSINNLVNYSASSNDTLIVCTDYIWNGNTYINSGIYVDTSNYTNSYWL